MAEIIPLAPARETMGEGVPSPSRAPRFYDRRRDCEKTPAVRVGMDLGYFTVERLAGYAIVSRTRCPTQAVARARVTAIAQAEGIESLPDRMPLTAAEAGADLDDGGDAA